MTPPTLDEMIAGFWFNPERREGASAQELAEAERRLGFPLPLELKSLLRLCDGGVTNYLLFGDILVPPFRGVTKNAPEHMVTLYLRGGDETLPAKVVIFAADAGAWFGLDYRHDHEPSVLHWSEYEEEPVQLAPSFRAFLAGLSRDIEEGST